jgi:hypothetical protein
MKSVLGLYLIGKQGDKMNRKTLFSAGTIAVLAVVVVAIVYASGRDDLAKIRLATEEFRSLDSVQAAGYSLVPDLDHCFNNPGVGAMGFHYINTASLDTQLDLLKPEAIVYAPDQDGNLDMVAVEYIVPAEPWDKDNSNPPELLGQHLHLNEALGVYVLHAWVWQKNPSGVFEDWNPEVSCPS